MLNLWASILACAHNLQHCLWISLSSELTLCKTVNQRISQNILKGQLNPAAPQKTQIKTKQNSTPRNAVTILYALEGACSQEIRWHMVQAMCSFSSYWHMILKSLETLPWQLSRNAPPCSRSLSSYWIWMRYRKAVLSLAVALNHTVQCVSLHSLILNPWQVFWVGGTG